MDIYEYELPWIRQGMTAKMDLPYRPGKHYSGKVRYIYPYLSPKTRTARLRLEFGNPVFELKPDMYANIYLESDIARNALVIPQEAVIDSGLRKVVFVALGKGKFSPREVKLGVEGNHNEYQVLDGLKAGDNIVVSAQFMLDSESRLREAIQKMLEVRQAGAEAGDNSDLDMTGITMDEDDLNMNGITMADEA